MFGKLNKLYGPQFLQGKIYKLVCKTSGDIYIGSTINDLKYRLTGHLNAYVCFNNKIKGVTYRASFEIFKNNNYQIELIEIFPCYSQYFLRRREGEYQRNLECINKHIAGRDQHLYYLNNKQRYDQYKKEWRINNPEKQKEIRKRENLKKAEKIPCPLCGKIMRKDSITNHQKSSRCIKK